MIRRAPSTPGRHPSGPPTGPAPEDTRTGIIRRTPTGSIPAQQPPEARTTHIPAGAGAADAPTGLIPSAGTPVSPVVQDDAPGARTVIATCVVAMLSGWAVSVVGTDLITGWWQTDRLFCLGVGFLTFVFAASTVSGVITLLLRRAVGHYLIITGAIVALLTFGAVFIAGAKVAWPVYVIPVLPVLSMLLAVSPGTRRWTH
nr:hypothetical protein [Mycolicibacterium mengxianglii]